MADLSDPLSAASRSHMQHDAAQAAHNAAMLEETRRARKAAEKHHRFSFTRVICLFILLGGVFLLIPFCMAVAGR